MNIFMDQALDLAEMGIGSLLGGPFGAVVVKDNKVVGSACNHVTSANDPTAHAEVGAIRDAGRNLNTFDLSGCELYTSCEPCPMCLGAIYWAHISKVFYISTRKDAANIGFDDDRIYEELAMKMDERFIPFIKLESQRAAEVFEKWTTLENERY